MSWFSTLLYHMLCETFLCTAGISHLVLVGGFAESSVLQHEIRKEFGHILKIIIPQGVGTITAKGRYVLYREFIMTPLSRKFRQFHIKSPKA